MGRSVSFHVANRNTYANHGAAIDRSVGGRRTRLGSDIVRRRTSTERLLFFREVFQPVKRKAAPERLVARAYGTTSENNRIEKSEENSCRKKNRAGTNNETLERKLYLDEPDDVRSSVRQSDASVLKEK